MAVDMVNHPPHYSAPHPVFSGQCIDYTRFMSFTVGNAFKYLWRWDRKVDPKEDLNKALWYINSAWEHAVDDRVIPGNEAICARIRDEVSVYRYSASPDERILSIATAQLALVTRYYSEAEALTGDVIEDLG